jgi:flotillin
VRLAAEASADAEAIRIRRVADATAESIQKVNEAIKSGGESYFRYRQIEMLPQIAPVIADALAQAKLITISNGGDMGAPEGTTNNITSVIQTVLAAQLVSRGLIDSIPAGASTVAMSPSAAEARLPSAIPASPASKK